MAVNHILRLCDYSLGGLKPFIYLIDKSALKLNIKAKGIEVFFQKRKDGDVKKVEASLCVYNQEETYANKFRFNSTLQVTVNEQYEEPFLYGLKELRKGQYYIIVEDMKGTQYLFNPELYTKFEYEYRFVNSGDNYNSVVIKFTNLSNFPLLIFAERVESNVLLFGNKCDYNIGEAAKLNMCLYNDLKVNDDGVLVNELYIDNLDKLKNVEFMKDSFTLKEIYDGKWFRSEMEFSLPLSNHQFEWAYDLIEFKNNKYKALVKTTNNNVIIVGNEKGLFPSYEIKTSEEVETPNMITFKFTHMSQYPIVYSLDMKQFRWIEDEPLCFGFDKYQMLKQQFSTDGGDTWQDTDPIVKKKGDIIERNSNDCKLTRWVDDDTYCYILGNDYIKWMKVNESYVCENGNKYEKLQKYISTDDVTFTAVEEYARGELIESKSNDCRYVAIRWVEDDKYACYEVDETQTRWVDSVEPICVDVNLFEGEIEEVTSNGVTFYPSGEYRTGIIVEENSCECGWTGTSFVFNNIYICGSEIGTEYEQTSKYEVWEEEDLCTHEKTGRIEYRNPQPSYDCGLVTYEWRLEQDSICGIELPENTEIVDTPPTNNT